MDKKPTKTPYKVPRKLSALLQTAMAQEEQQIQIPRESLAGVHCTTPILDPEVQEQVDMAMVPFTCHIRWEKWGMERLVGKRSAILLQGPPGTGKTTIARYCAKKVGQAVISIAMGDIGGSDPGATERNLKHIFEEARKDRTPVFIDECDSILWSRDKAGPDSMWMLAVVNALLKEIEISKLLVVLATNHAHFLDPALRRRLSAIIDVPFPSEATRLKIWQAFIPESFPIQPKHEQFRLLAKANLTGAEIQNAIETEARAALVQGRVPKFDSLCNIANKLAKAARQADTQTDPAIQHKLAQANGATAKSTSAQLAHRTIRK